MFQFSVAGYTHEDDKLDRQFVNYLMGEGEKVRWEEQQ